MLVDTAKAVSASESQNLVSKFISWIFEIYAVCCMIYDVCCKLYDVSFK